MDFETKEILRNLKVDVLRFLMVLCSTKDFAVELQTISKSTNTSEPELKGVIGTLRRMKIKGQSFIVAAGRDDEGRLRWKINKDFIRKSELAKFLEDEILGRDSIKFQQ